MPDHTLTRRRFLTGLALSAALPALAACGAAAEAKAYPVSFSEAEWRRRLTPQQFRILRLKGTERSFTSPLLNEHRRGTFVCAADGNALFSSATKYDSGTGWPSFWRPLPARSAPLSTANWAMRAPKCTACAAEDIWAMSSTMARRPRASAIA